MTRKEIKDKYGYAEVKTDNFLRRAARGLETFADHPLTLLLTIVVCSLIIALSIWKPWA